MERIDALMREYDNPSDTDECAGGGRRKNKKSKGKSKGSCGSGVQYDENYAESTCCYSAAAASVAGKDAGLLAALDETADALDEMCMLDEFDDLICIACNKRFKNAAQWANHAKSKVRPCEI